MNFTVIIPARYASTRFPAKPLADINGKPMVVHVMERARVSGASRVIVALDHPEVAKAVEIAAGESYMTRIEHHSGTERLAEVIEYYRFSDEKIIVNVQGDEPMIPPPIIRQVAENLKNSCAGIATLAVPIKNSEEAVNPNVVKVVIDAQGYALYFSRATIPWDRRRFTISQDTIDYTPLRHIGIYAYRAGFIRRYVNWKPSQLEQVESLEQLRVLWYGEKIHVAIAKVVPSIGVDTIQDLQRVRNYFS
ncbi:3-deoxy-manno-octulosonate cytidylyltransferase [Candidatus Gillettellia adelgis]